MEREARLKKRWSDKRDRLLDFDKSIVPSALRLCIFELCTFGWIAGVDEAGRGPLAGPVVAGAVILKRTDFESRIDDSKKLSPKQRDAAYLEITDKAVFSFASIDHILIDKVNIFRASCYAMEQAVSKLPVRPDYVLADGKPKLNLGIPAKNIISGDSLSLSIACASIIAKVTRDKMMVEYDKLYPEYGFAKHKGYGTREHKEVLRKHGPCPIHRRSFLRV